MPKAKRVRDAQISRVEDAIESVITAGQATRFGDIQLARDWVQQIGRSRWMKSKYPEFSGSNPSVWWGRRVRYPRYESTGDIMLPRWNTKYLNDLDLLHLVAHVISEQRTGNKLHNREWAHIYVALVKRFCKSATYETLIRAFRAHKVKFRNSRLKTTSKSGRSGNAEALARYRAKKKEAIVFGELANLLTQGNGK